MGTTSTRKLAAIMFTDIAGFTESMSYDEEQAIQAVRKKRTIIQPLIKQYDGVFVKEIGDGTLSYFNSAIDASNCAINLQELTYDDESLNLRAGLHIGDIVFDGDDVFGDGVNIASRLESISPIGGICISKNIYDELLNKRGYDAISLGLQSLKGIGRVIEVYALKSDKLKDPDKLLYVDTKVEKHNSNEVPSIAIIPFENKGDDEDVFYAYGISADLISDCSGAGLIRVASLNNIEKIDNFQKLQAEEIASKLDVRYTAEGTLWKMGNIFQLSIELYDTKEKKVVWSDRWQENWENLPTIKGNLSDGLLQALATTPKQEKRIETINPESYELYLKAKHKYEKRENTDDSELVRLLLNKSIEIDDTLIIAKTLLGRTYEETGDYDRAMEIYTPALKQAKELGDSSGVGKSLNHIGIVYWQKGELDKALDYFKRSLKKFEELIDKLGIGNCLNNIGLIYREKDDLDKALDYYQKSIGKYEELGNKYMTSNSLGNIGLVYQDLGDYDKSLGYQKRALVIREEFGDNSRIGLSLNNIGILYKDKGHYDKALNYLERSLVINEKLGDKSGLGRNLYNMGCLYADISDYQKSLECLEKSLTIRSEIGQKELEINTIILIYLNYKYLDKDYDEQEIHRLIKEEENIGFEINFRLYELLEDKSYLETAYNQIQEKADVMDDERKEKFLSYPIPEKIIDKHKKVVS